MMKAILKVGFIITLLAAGLVPRPAFSSEGITVDTSKINPKDIKWFDTAIRDASRKFPIRITIKTPNKTEALEGMFFELAYQSGKKVRENGVITFSDDAMVEIKHGVTPSRIRQFKADWISIHWVRIKGAKK